MSTCTCMNFCRSENLIAWHSRARGTLARLSKHGHRPNHDRIVATTKLAMALGDGDDAALAPTHDGRSHHRINCPGRPGGARNGKR